jgi:hypothetical protein
MPNQLAHTAIAQDESIPAECRRYPSLSFVRLQIAYLTPHGGDGSPHPKSSGVGHVVDRRRFVRHRALIVAGTPMVCDRKPRDVAFADVRVSPTGGGKTVRIANAA